MFKYEYEKSNANVSKINESIKTYSFGGYINHINYEDNILSIFFVQELTAEEIDMLDSLVINHTSTPTYESTIKKRILFAMRIGSEIMADFGAENKNMVANSEMTTEDMANLATNLASIQMLISSGSLEMARAAIASLNDMPGLDSTRRQKHLDKIDSALLKLQQRYPLE